MADINKDTLVSLLTDIADGFRTSRSLTSTLSLDEMAELAAVPIGSTENKLAQLVDNKLTDITAEDLEGATSIRIYAFNFSGIINITIPDSVITIGNSAFSNCGKLKNVIIGNNVTTIGSSAFENCYNITNLTIPSSVTKINIYALRMGYYDRKTTFTFLGTTPPTIDANTFNASYINKIIVPTGSGETYKTATNWANYADYIEEAAV